MAQITKEFLSASTNGRNIPISAASSPGTTLHTVPAGTSSKDEIYIYAQNVSSSSGLVKLTVQFGGTTASNDDVEFSIAPESGTYLIIPGWLLTDGLAVTAFGSIASAIMVNGFVNRIT